MRFLSNPAIIKKVSDGVISGDMTVSLESNVFDIRTIIGYSMQAEYSGSPNGTLKLQASNDDPDVPEAQTWIDVTSSSAAISASGSRLWNQPTEFYGWLKLVYTASSGSGTLTAKIVTKGF